MLRGSKAKPLKGKAAHLDNNRLQKESAKVCLDCTGVSGALFLQKSAKYGVVAARQGLGASHFAEKGFQKSPQRSGRKCVWTAQARADRVYSEIR